MGTYKKKLKALLEALEVQEIEYLMKQDVETLKVFGEYMTKCIKDKIYANWIPERGS